MTVTAGLAAMGILAAVGLLRLPQSVGRRRLRALSPVPAPTRRSRSTRVRRDTARWTSILAGLACFVVLGWPVGLVVGGFVAFGLDRWLHRLPRRAQQAAEERRATDVPLAADLLAAALLSGATHDAALAAVGEALPASIGPDLVRVARASSSGASAEEAWVLVASDLHGLAEVFLRSSASGTPAATGLVAFAAQCRAVRRMQLRERAGKVGVRSALPLSVCFLPAFLLLGVVPVVAGLVRTLLR